MTSRTFLSVHCAVTITSQHALLKYYYSPLIQWLNLPSQQPSLFRLSQSVVCLCFFRYFTSFLLNSPISVTTLLIQYFYTSKRYKLPIHPQHFAITDNSNYHPAVPPHTSLSPYSPCLCQRQPPLTWLGRNALPACLAGQQIGARDAPLKRYLCTLPHPGPMR